MVGPIPKSILLRETFPIFTSPLFSPLPPKSHPRRRHTKVVGEDRREGGNLNKRCGYLRVPGFFASLLSLLHRPEC